MTTGIAAREVSEFAKRLHNLLGLTYMHYSLPPIGEDIGQTREGKVPLLQLESTVTCTCGDAEYASYLWQKNISHLGASTSHEVAAKAITSINP